MRGFVSTAWTAGSSRMMNGKDSDLGRTEFAGGLGFWISHMVLSVLSVEGENFFGYCGLP